MTGPSRQPDPPGRLWYLSCEMVAEGQASYTHVMGISRGLATVGWQVRLWHPIMREGPRSAIRRLVDVTMMQLRLLARRDRPDALYVRGHFLSLPTVVWARLHHVPTVWELNGPGDDVLSSWPWLRSVLRLLQMSISVQLRLSTVAIAVTPALAEVARRRGARAAFVVSNGADTDRFEPGAATTVALPPIFAVFVGTLATWQGVPTMLDAVEDPAWPAAVSLVIVGDGVMADAVRERSAHQERIRFLGRIPHREVPGVLARSIVALSPMAATDRLRSGVVPLKLFEAMACGVAVIVSDLPGQADLVRESGSGMVVPPGDASALAAAVASLAASRSTARGMGAAGRVLVLGHYSWAAKAAQTDRIIRDVAS